MSWTVLPLRTRALARRKPTSRRRAPGPAGIELDHIARTASRDGRQLDLSALFAGLRRGELRGLQVDDMDFDAGLIHVRGGWDDLEGEIDPKTFAGARDVPMIGELRRICRAHKLQTGRHGTQLFLGRTPGDPFYPSTIRLRALKAWGWKQALEPLTPHEARHCAASYMIAAGMDWKKITEFIGHSDVRTTYNRYGKVVPEDLVPAATQLEEYFERGRAGLE